MHNHMNWKQSPTSKLSFLGNKNNVHTKYKTVKPVIVPTPIKNAQPSKEPALIPTEHSMYIQTPHTLVLGIPSQNLIS